MSFSAYYSSSRRSGRSRRFRVTLDSGEKSLSGGAKQATWEEVQKESGGEGEQVVGSGGKGREQRSGAEVGSGGRERRSGAKVGSGGHESDDEGAHEGALPAISSPDTGNVNTR